MSRLIELPEDTRMSILRYVGARNQAMDIDPNRLIDEIQSYKPDFNLEEVLLALEERERLKKRFQGTQELEFYRFLQRNWSNLVQNDGQGYYIYQFLDNQFDTTDNIGSTAREIGRIFGGGIVDSSQEPYSTGEFTYSSPNLVEDLYLLDAIYSSSIPTMESLQPKNNLVYASAPGRSIS